MSVATTRVAHAVRVALVALLAGGCAPDFEEPGVVVDLRLLGIQVTPPEIVVPIDLDDPSQLELEDVRVCALVADPGATRSLQFQMAACAPTDDGRCAEPGEPTLAFGSDTIDDPEVTAAPVSACATLQASPGLLEIIRFSIENDPLQGFSSVGVQLELRIGADDDVAFGAKRMAYAPAVPAERVANTNPTLDGVTAVGEGVDAPAPVTLARCADPAAVPIEVASGATLELEPVEPEGVREDYVLPTFDGGTRELTENLSYQWFATAGSWDSLETGGAIDVFGNSPPLDNTWTAPEVTAPEPVSLWLVQRDERGGLAWFEMCARVAP